MEAQPGKWDLQLGRLKTKQNLEWLFIKYGMEDAASELHRVPLSEIVPWDNNTGDSDDVFLLYEAFSWTNAPQGTHYWRNKWSELNRRYEEENTSC